MWNFPHLPCPNDKFRGVFEVAARNVDRWICLLPSDDIQNLVAKFSQAISHRKDVVVSATNPYSTIILQFVTTQTQPFHIERHHVFL